MRTSGIRTSRDRTSGGPPVPQLPKVAGFFEIVLFLLLKHDNLMAWSTNRPSLFSAKSIMTVRNQNEEFIINRD